MELAVTDSGAMGVEMRGPRETKRVVVQLYNPETCTANVLASRA